MTSTRRVCIAVLVLAAFTAAFAASSCNIDHCSACLLGHCTWCEDGYYVSNGACAACESAHCRKCAIAGRCTSCNDGYQLTYISGSSNGTSIAKYGTCEPKSNAASACSSEPHCTSCIGQTCLYCENGYYAKDGKCASCESANCAHCELAGRCVQCESGYKLSYANSSDSGITISRWGTCSANGASFTNAYVALVSAAVVAVAVFAA